jgi:isopropylmalate/homocitrate/citramalate synthase
MNKFNFVSCAHSFKKWVNSNSQYRKVYDNIGSPTPFDVTLLDGMSSLNKYQISQLKTDNKLNYYRIINFHYHPKNIEIGAFASKKAFPIFKDTNELSKKISEYNFESRSLNNFNIPNVYVVIPNEKQFNLNYSENNNINNYSFITSISNSFQLNNTKMSLRDSFNDINNIIVRLDDSKNKFNSKLYVSCINECPFEGKFSNDYIVDSLLKLNSLKTDMICLSDTCGTLQSSDFKYIIQKSLNAGINNKKISLHMHIHPKYEKNTEKIFNIALDHGINNFDVSLFKNVTDSMEKNKQLSNLSYPLYYKFLQSYIISKTD